MGKRLRRQWEMRNSKWAEIVVYAWIIIVFVSQLFDENLPVAQKGQVQPASKGGADDAYERKTDAQLKLWKYG